jgi:anti-sigma regulatory factor (Ser/Thr protein kinase)
VIASELVANAIVHGSAPVVLSVFFQDPDVSVEVSDGDPHTENVQLRSADDPEPGGHGLKIVASFADRWGVRPSPHGKTVWATKRATG